MTIYALSTGPGISGIAVIRVSGLEAKKAIELLTKKNLPSPKVATLRKISKINTSELIDEGLVLWFPGLRATQEKTWLNSIYMGAKQ